LDDISEIVRWKFGQADRADICYRHAHRSTTSRSVGERPGGSEGIIEKAAKVDVTLPPWLRYASIREDERSY
jgi:hypothetical protein